MRKAATPLTSGIVQRSARDADGVADGADEAVSTAATSSGTPLPHPVMRKFEASLGADLSGVRVHTGDASAVANDAVGARAFTAGQDIHFGDGQYDPSSPDGEHLLAHEVAHTVQQRGGDAPATQFKLAVSSPGDGLEHDADRAADAMVRGEPAAVGDGASAGIQRQASPAGALPQVPIEIQVQEAKTKPKSLGPFQATGKLGGKVTLKPATGDAASGVEKKVGFDKGKVKGAAEKEIGTGWNTTVKLAGEVEFEKGEPKLNVGGSVEHPGWELKKGTFGPLAISAKAFEWQPGKELKFGIMEASAGLKTTTAKAYMGHQVEVAFQIGVEVEPNWDEVKNWIVRKAAASIASGAAGAAGAMAVPFAAAAGMLYAWSKAGHEFDEVHREIVKLRDRCRLACAEAVTGKHTPVMVGNVNVNASTTDLAKQVRAAVATQLKIPEGAIEQAGKEKANLPSLLYQAAWSKTWPDLKAKLKQNYKDTFWKSYKFERMWLDSFDTGDFSKG